MEAVVGLERRSERMNEPRSESSVVKKWDILTS